MAKILYCRTEEKLSTIPVYREYGTTMDFMGSGNLLLIRGSHFLVTAAHCADFDDENGKLLHVAGGDEVFVIKRKMFATRIPDGMQRRNDPIDFCAVKLTNEEVAMLSKRCSFILEESMETQGSSESSPLMSMIGYLASDNRVEEMYCEVNANALCISTLIKTDCKEKRFREHPDRYICLSYDHLTSSVAVDQKSAGPKKLSGMSGGAVWRGYCGWRSPTFAGMLIEHNECEKSVIALSSSVILAYIRRWWVPLHGNQ